MAKAISGMSLLLLLAVAPFSAMAAEATVSQLLANPTAFDGKHVTVSGSAQYVRPKTSRKE
jgi:hypothetical protein